MTEHYFTNNPNLKPEIRQFEAELCGKRYRFKTDAGVFSKQELDEGSRLLISVLPQGMEGTVLDLGCGYGPIGIVAADFVAPTGFVDMVDVNTRAVELANHNLEQNQIVNAKAFISEGFTAVQKKYNWILTNPPIRAGKQVIHQMVEDAYDFLLPAGRLVMVIRTKQGASSMASKLKLIFGQVETLKKNKGYRILQSIKTSHPE